MAEEGSKADVRKAALRAIDQEETRRILRTASGRDPDEQAVTALRETLADEATELAVEAAKRARRRGRAPEGEDLGRAADERYRAYYG